MIDKERIYDFLAGLHKKLNEVCRHLAIRTLLTEEEKKVGNMSCSEENLQTQRKMQH